MLVSTVAASVGLVAYLAKPITVGDITINGPLIAGPLVVWTHPSNIRGPSSPNYALQFWEDSGDDVGRVDMERSTQEETGIEESPLNFGTDFTIEGWIFAGDENDREDMLCNQSGDGWVGGNVFMDADRNSGGVDNDWGLALSSGQIMAGIADGSNSYTLCSTSDMRDSTWHHFAITRDASEGDLSIYIDGTRENTTSSAPTGSVAFIMGTAGNPYDHMITLGVEHHDAPGTFDFTGMLDEIRFSDVVRYTGASFSVPSGRFTPDANTVGLFHLDEGTGTTAANSATVEFDPFWDPDGTLSVGGSPSSPAWVTSTADTGS